MPPPPHSASPAPRHPWGRYTLLLLATLPLLAFLALWLHSYSWSQHSAYLHEKSTTPGGHLIDYSWILVSHRGGIYFGYHHVRAPRPSQSGPGYWYDVYKVDWQGLEQTHPLAASSGSNPYFFGFAYDPYTDNGLESMWAICIPDWFIALLLAAPIALLTRSLYHHHRRRYRLTHALCPTCAYDLRIHLEGGAGPTCPECGTPVPAVPPPSCSPRQ